LNKILLFANTGWYLYNYRQSLARAVAADGAAVVLVSPPDRYSRMLEQAGFAWRQVELSRRAMDPVADLRFFAACLRLYRRERPTLVHHFTAKPVVYGTWAARLARVPAVVNSVTGLGYAFVTREARGRILRPIVIGLYRSALGSSRSWTIFQNPDDRSRFLELGIVDPSRATLIVGSGVDLQRFRTTREPAGMPVVVLPARMLWDKGVGELVEAARLVRERGVPVRVRLAGAPDPGNPASIPESQLKAWAEAGLAEWIGHQDDMPAVYAACHIVALPTYYGEGLPRSLVEAGASGRPVIATDVPGCRAVVEPGENGLLVEPRSVAPLAQALLDLCVGAERRARMGQRGRQMAEERFSDERIVGETMKLYRTMSTLGPGHSPTEGSE